MECAKSELRGKVTKIALKAGNLISHSSTHFIPLQTPREKRMLPLFARNPCVSQWRLLARDRVAGFGDAGSQSRAANLEMSGDSRFKPRPHPRRCPYDVTINLWLKKM